MSSGLALVPETRRWAPRFAWLVAGVTGVVGASMLGASAHTLTGDPVCLLRRIAHVPCPTCGMTRALALLVAGDWRAALALHPWAPMIALEIVAGWALWGATLAGAPRRAERGVLARLAPGAQRSSRVSRGWWPSTRPRCSSSGSRVSRPERCRQSSD